MGEDNRGRRYIPAVSEASYGDARMAHDEHVSIGEPARRASRAQGRRAPGVPYGAPHPRIDPPRRDKARLSLLRNHLFEKAHRDISHET